jgi:hypothetical protein
MGKAATSQAAATVAQMMTAKQKAREAKRRQKLSGMAPGGADVGPGLAIERGLVEVETNALIPDQPDDKRSNAVIGTRAKRVWPPDRLIGGRNPALEQHQHDSARRLLDEFTIGILGATNHTPSGTYTAPWSRCPYQERRAMARQSFLSATRAVGLRFGSILVWCVLMETGSPDLPPTVEGYAKRMSPAWTIDRTVGFLSGALEALAVHYGYSRQNSPSARRDDKR